MIQNHRAPKPDLPSVDPIKLTRGCVGRRRDNSRRAEGQAPLMMTAAGIAATSGLGDAE